MMTLPKIEQCGTAVYAVHVGGGVAVYGTLEDLLIAVRDDAVECDDECRAYYEAREWREVSRDDLELYRDLFSE